MADSIKLDSEAASTKDSTIVTSSDQVVSSPTQNRRLLIEPERATTTASIRSSLALDDYEIIAFVSESGRDPSLRRSDHIVSYGGNQAIIKACAFSARLPCQLLSADGRQVYHGTSTDAHFHFSDHISSLQVILHHPQDPEQKSAKLESVLRFPALAVKELRMLGIKNRFSDREGHEEVKIRYKSEHINAERFFVPGTNECNQSLISHITDFDTLRLRFSDQPSVFSHLIALGQQFEKDWAATFLSKWIPHGGTGFSIRRNTILEPGDRPNTAGYELKNSFFNYHELIIVNSIAQLEEYEKEVENSSEHNEKVHDAIFCEMTGGHERITLAMLDIPLSYYMHVKAGNSASISRIDRHGRLFKLEYINVPTYAAHFAQLPKSYLPIRILGEWDDETGSLVRLGDVNLVRLQEQDNAKTTAQKIREAETVDVSVQIRANQKQCDNRLEGLTKLSNAMAAPKEAQHLVRVLVGNNISGVTLFDLYETLSATIADPISLMGQMNEGQRTVVSIARSAPARIINVHGPPGTGKTHVCAELVRPFIIANRPGTQILATSVSNTSTDALAMRYHRMILADGHKGQFCIRAHAYETETDIIRQHVKSERGRSRRVQAAEVQLSRALDADDLKFVASIRAAYYLQKESRSVDGKPSRNFISDQRVTEESLRLSIGYRVLQYMGEIPAGNGDPTPDPAKTAVFRDLYHSHHNEKAKDYSSFQKALTVIRNDLLKQATVVCATPALAVQASLYNPISSSVAVVVVDEASRILECDVLALMGCYPDAKGYLMAGDPNQMPPHVDDSPNVTWRFKSQMRVSLQQRLLANGTPSAFLNEQYRMAPNISRPVNMVGYHGKLTDHVSVTKEHRPMLKRIEQFNRTKFGRSQHSVLFRLRKTETKNASWSKSKYNPRMACFCINLAIDYLTEFPNLQIAIICFYEAQKHLYLAIREAMIQEDADFGRLNIVTAGCAQGLEFDCTIVDVAIGDTAGFLKDLNRLLVAISRARLSSNLVVDMSAAVSANAELVTDICRLYTEVGRSVVIEEESSLAGMYTSEFYDKHLMEF